MRELTSEEIKQVGGGVFPLVVAGLSWGLSFAGHVAARSAIGHLASGISLGLSTIGMGMALGDDEGS